jgi:fucose 4-O-acetylase-like acetyltransferase
MQNAIELPKQTKKLNYINVFRGLAILLIIMGHTMQFESSNSIVNMLNCEMICGSLLL